MDDRLRPLWDFGDLEASESRLRAQLELEETAAGRAEVLTQLARVEGLRTAFEEADALLEEAAALAGESAVAAARVDLERGRIRRSAGDPEAARPLFASAYTSALHAEQYFVAADAAHMAALVAPDRDACVAWTKKGIALAEAHDGASYWTGPLLNNLGWEHYDAGGYEAALDAFRRALAARERDPASGDGLALARYAVGKTLRALDRPGEAIALLEQAVDWATGQGKPDGWYHEELALEYAELGRAHDARSHARVAIPLLERDDAGFTDDDERRRRLETLALAD